MFMDRVKNKVAIVTGGASGIGRATCLLLAKEGAKVAVADINDVAGKKVVSEIKAAGGEAGFWHINVTSEKEVQQGIADIYKTFGKIDVLVNDAGIPGTTQTTDKLDEKEWDAVMGVNAKGAFFCTKHTVPYMKKGGGGSIIYLSSIYGLVGHYDPAYHAAKGAVRLLAKADAYCYAKDKIRVNSVHPGAIKTPIMDFLINNSGVSSEKFMKAVESLHPVGHIGEPDDVAYGILYLASDESKFVTGSELVIDGGYTAQ